MEKTGGEVIVERHGQPRAAIVSYEALQEFRKSKERLRRQDALARLRQLDAEASARNQDLTEGEADELAVRFSRAFWQEIAGNPEPTAPMAND